MDLKLYYSEIHILFSERSSLGDIIFKKFTKIGWFVIEYVNESSLNTSNNFSNLKIVFWNFINVDRIWKQGVKEAVAPANRNVS